MQKEKEQPQVPYELKDPAVPVVRGASSEDQQTPRNSRTNRQILA